MGPEKRKEARSKASLKTKRTPDHLMASETILHYITASLVGSAILVDILAIISISVQKRLEPAFGIVLNSGTGEL